MRPKRVWGGVWCGCALAAMLAPHGVTVLGYDLPLGWCRAIRILDNDRVIVGFSRLRSTKLADKVRWAKAQVKRIAGMSGYEDTLPLLPTRICCLDLQERKMEWEWDLEEFGMNAVFSIL